MTYFYFLVRTRNGVTENLCGSLDLEAVLATLRLQVKGFALHDGIPIPSFRIESVEVLT